jgi:hypothetical protein
VHRELWSRRRRVVVAIAIAAILIVLYVLATIPIASQSFSITVGPSHLLPFTPALSPKEYANYSGSGVLWVSAGSDVSGTWATADGSVILMLVEYDTTCQSNTGSSGSFHFNGALPWGPGGSSIVVFDVTSPNPVNVTIQGTYTTPLI